jgi:hypothetical protein
VTDDSREGERAPGAGEEAAWAALRARWGDDGAHREFLSRVNDLDGLARAGARYREALSAAPGDVAAARGRDEVLRKAAVLGLAAVPRTAPPRPASPWAKRALVAAILLLLLGAAAWTGIALLHSGAAR